MRAHKQSDLSHYLCQFCLGRQILSRLIFAFHYYYNNVNGFLAIFNAPGHNISYKIACETSEDSDQPAHPRDLISLNRAKESERLLEDSEDWVESQADLSRRWAHMQSLGDTLFPAQISE